MIAATRLDVTVIREQALGKWREILTRLGMDLPATSKQHGPCPACGGKDRFRFDDQEGKGTWFCNQCQPQAGDGFHLVQNVRGCDFPQALRLVADALGFQPSTGQRERKIIAEYDYTDATGQVLFQVVRFAPKDFRQRRPDGHGGWYWNLEGVPRVLYRLPRILAADSQPIIIHEGEKAVEEAERAGLPGIQTTASGGADNASFTDYSPLAGRAVVICLDNDDAGARYAKKVGEESVRAGAASVKLLRLPGLPLKGDVVEWLSSGGTAEEFQDLVEQAEEFVFMSLPKKGTLHEREFSPLPVGDFLDLGEGDEAVDWILDEYLPAGGLVLLAGKPKEGKTTLTYELAVRVAKGWPFLNRSSSGGGVLIVALEEHPRDVRLRLRALGADGLPNLFILAKPVDPTSDTFEAINRFVTEHSVKLVLLDTLGAFWKVRDENDAAEVTQAMKPFLALARETGACVLLIHHARKSEGSYGDEIRGSGALFAAVDVPILKRHEVQTQRILHAISRYPETPAEVVLELREAGYVALGDPANLNKQARRDKIKAALRQEPEEPHAISKRAEVSLRDTYRLLGALVESGEAVRDGKGRKGSPLRYAQNTIHATPQVIGKTLHETNSRQTEFDSCSPPSPCMNENSTMQLVEVIEDVS